MPKSEKRVSISTMDSIMKEQYANISEEDWAGIRVKIKRTLPLRDMLEFVSDAVGCCFQENGEYMPELLDFAIRANILTRYANFSMPDNLEHRYELAYNTDAVDFVCGKINSAQLNEIIAAINRKLHYMCESNVNAVMDRIKNITASFEDLEAKMSAVFDNITPQDVANIAGAFANGDFDESKIVSAYLDQARKGREAEQADT